MVRIVNAYSLPSYWVRFKADPHAAETYEERRFEEFELEPYVPQDAERAPTE